MDRFTIAGQGKKGVAYTGMLRQFDGVRCLYCGSVILPPKVPKGALSLADCTCNKTCKDKLIPKMVGKWREFHAEIMNRDEYTCKVPGCGEKSNLTVHHIVPIEHGGQCYDPKNCEVLCDRHHKEKHGRGV
jgi:5-methylcytosine-specific restriction endonuclease McrA